MECPLLYSDSFKETALKWKTNGLCRIGLFINKGLPQQECDTLNEGIKIIEDNYIIIASSS